MKGPWIKFQWHLICIESDAKIDRCMPYGYLLNASSFRLGLSEWSHLSAAWKALCIICLSSLYLQVKTLKYPLAHILFSQMPLVKSNCVCDLSHYLVNIFLLLFLGFPWRFVEEKNLDYNGLLLLISYFSSTCANLVCRQPNSEMHVFISGACWLHHLTFNYFCFIIYTCLCFLICRLQRCFFRQFLDLACYNLQH